MTTMTTMTTTTTRRNHQKALPTPVTAELHAVLEYTRLLLLMRLNGWPTTHEPMAFPRGLEKKYEHCFQQIQQEEAQAGECAAWCLRQQLTEMDHALAKFAAGTYGLCEICGQPIPLARLKEIPWARYDGPHEVVL